MKNIILTLIIIFIATIGYCNNEKKEKNNSNKQQIKEEINANIENEKTNAPTRITYHCLEEGEEVTIYGGTNVPIRIVFENKKGAMLIFDKDHENNPLLLIGERDGFDREYVFPCIMESWDMGYIRLKNLYGGRVFLYF